MPRTPRASGDELDHQRASVCPLFGPVGGDHALVDAPGRFDLDVTVVGEEPVEAVDLAVGEQAAAGVQGPSGLVERVVFEAAVAVDLELNPASALVECVAG